MSNAPFDRTILNPREKPLSQDINQAESQLDRALRFFAEQLFSSAQTGASISGFLKRGFSVVEQSPSGMFVRVNSGLGFQEQVDGAAVAIDSILGLNDLSTYKPMVLLADSVFTVPTAPVAPNSRIDIIEVKAEFLTGEPNERLVLNTGTGVFEPDTVNKILTWTLDGRVGTVNAPANSTQPLSYKVGVAANPGTVPDTTDGYIKLAEIAVGSDVTTIADADVTDLRQQLLSNQRWISLGADKWRDSSSSEGVDENFWGVTSTTPPRWSAITNLGAVGHVVQFPAGSVIDQLEVHHRDDNVTGNNFNIRRGVFGTASPQTQLGLQLFPATGSEQVSVLDSSSLPAVFPLIIGETDIVTLRFIFQSNTAHFYGARAQVRLPLL